MYDSDKVIACRTCIWKTGSKCDNELRDCLESRDLGISVAYYQLTIPKNVSRYAYAHWEPTWEVDKLPDELFEI